MTKAALYARVSTDGQQKEGTIESQLAELRKQVAAAGYVVLQFCKLFGGHKSSGMQLLDNARSNHSLAGYPSGSAS
jgi:DNA invertase Pin-like site-specific DNA recombinase